MFPTTIANLTAHRTASDRRNVAHDTCVHPKVVGELRSVPYASGIDILAIGSFLIKIVQRIQCSSFPVFDVDAL